MDFSLKYDKRIFGLSWIIISVILEIWWLIAVIVSAVRGDECGWDAIEGQDWFVIIVVLLIFFGQFSIGELIGFIEFQISEKMNVGMFPKWIIITFQVIAGLYLCLNVLALANNVNQKAFECWTGIIMLVTICVNLAYCIITFIFSFITLPLADINNPENENKKEKIPQKDEEEEKEHLVDTEQKQKEKGDDDESDDDNAAKTKDEEN